MGTREDFEKQARLLDAARREGYAHRQPEIDALKAENELNLAANRGLGLRKAAEDLFNVVEELFGDFGHLDFQEKMENLRAALERKPTPSDTDKQSPA